jgi:hypothetical protein
MITRSITTLLLATLTAISALKAAISTNRPAGIAALFKTLANRVGTPHDAEHRMIDCLAETLWEAQSKNTPPDEAAYLERLRRL